jgi:hypothetical protein
LNHSPRTPSALGSAQTVTSKNYYKKNYTKRLISSGHNKIVVLGD